MQLNPFSFRHAGALSTGLLFVLALFTAKAATEPINSKGAPHWAYQAPEKPPLPKVQDQTWPRSDLDRFILAQLEREGLKPSAEAAPQNLLRRVTLDLTGLPPTPVEVDALLADQSPDAYEKVVDRLLASTAFGERMAELWLDLARYADSDGYHADTARSMWQYRDYVIHSFNANKSFDAFVTEQIAGDLLPNATLEQRIATAFNRNGMSSTEGGADPDEYMNKYVTDRVNTFGTVFLGSSVACAECHDHKYDPFTQREYYQLYDFFNRIPERGLDSDPAPPFIKVPTPENTAALSKLTNEIVALETDRRGWLDRENAAIDQDQSKWEEAHRQTISTGWQTVPPTNLVSLGGATFTILDDQSVLVSGTNADQDVYEFTLPTTHTQLNAVRLEALTHQDLPRQGVSRSENANFVLSGFELEAQSAEPAREPAPTEIELGAWSLLGSFKAATAKEVFEKAFINEGEPDLAASYEEGRLKWISPPPFWKDGVQQPLWGENSVTYFHRTLTVKTARYAALQVGSDGGVQAWLNGAKVQDGRVWRGTASEPDRLVIDLKEGENKLLLKVHHGSGAKGFLFAVPPEPLTQYPVPISIAVADYEQKDYPIKAALDDKADTGWAVDGQEEKLRAPRQAIFFSKNRIAMNGGLVLKLKLKFQSNAKQHSLGRFRLAVANSTGSWETLAGLPRGVQTALFTASSHLEATQKTQLKEYYRDHFWPELKAVNEKLAQTVKARTTLYDGIPTLRVMEDMPEPRETQIRLRGDYRHRGDKVTAAVPRFLPALPTAEKPDRLALARWLVDPGHPLLSRVTVNRYWALYFGTGFVKTGNEFGTQGERPVHPALLDWLAREFIESGWNVKALQKLIVMSATYRQRSHLTPELLERDPSNRWMARGPRLRLSAEMIRDCALDYAGLLDRQRPPGGPSVKPYQPAGLWEEKMFGGNKYEESKGADLYRRSLYTLWKRTVLNPVLMTFDAPDRAICTDQRNPTCTPLQAFVTLNEKGFIEAARALAERILRQAGPTIEDRMNLAYKIVLARLPSPSEQEIIRAIHADMLASYQRDLKAALDLINAGDSKRTENLNEIELAAWTAVANALLNLDEAITKE